MTNKLVVIINNLKVPKIKKILLYELKYLVPNYSCLQNSWLGGYRSQIPVLPVLCHQLNLLSPPNKIPKYATERDFRFSLQFLCSQFLCSFQNNVKFSGHIYCRYPISHFVKNIQLTRPEVGRTHLCNNLCFDTIHADGKTDVCVFWSDT